MESEDQVNKEQPLKEEIEAAVIAGRRLGKTKMVMAKFLGVDSSKIDEIIERMEED